MTANDTCAQAAYATDDIAEWRLPIADFSIVECRLRLCECRMGMPNGDSEAEWRLGMPSGDWNAEWRLECRVAIGNAEWRLGMPSGDWECRMAIGNAEWRLRMPNGD
jgi:hypothetical protein